MDSKKNLITHIVPATAAFVSLALVLVGIFFGLYEQWMSVAICIFAIVLDFYIYIVLTKKIEKINDKHSNSKTITSLKY